MSDVPRRPLFMAAATLFALTPNAILAQTPAAADEQKDSTAQGGVEEIEEIVVTGIRASLAAGIEIKRSSDQIVDSIVAEDIGKLPDQNAAESLGRISGVQVRRGIDEASEVSIRGLRQNRLEFNGRTLISPYGRGPDGPDDGAYNILTLIPSELISRMDVTKLPAASQVEGSLGGTVNILTRRPDPSGELFAGGSAELVYKDKAEDDESYRLTGLVSKAFFDGTLGISLGANYQELNILQDSTDSFNGWRPVPNTFSANPAVRDPNGDGVNIFFYNDIRYQRLQERREKYGVTTSVQWQPVDSFEGYFDFLYAHAETDRDRQWLSIPLSTSGAAYTGLVVSEHENIIAGTVRAVIQGNGERILLPTDIYSGAVGGKWAATDRLNIGAEVSYTESTQDYQQSYLRADTAVSSLIGFDFRGTDVPSVSLPAAVDPADPAQFIFRTSFDNLFEYAAEEITGRLDLQYAVGAPVLDQVELGLRYNKITSTRVTSRDQSIFPASGAGVLQAASFPNNFEIVNFDDLIGSASGAFPSSFLIPLPEFGDLAGVCRVFVPSCTPERLDPTSSYELEEPITAAYVQANLKSSLFGVAFTGNVGMRYARTEVTADGFFGVRGSTSANAFTPTNIDISYDDWLPSAALRFEVTDDLLLRIGAARVLARPDTRDLSPSFSITTQGTGAGGNPALEPFRVNQADIALEWYPAQSTVLALSLFYKDVESFIFTRQVEEVIPGLDADASAPPADRDTNPNTPFRINRTFNGSGAEIKGFEVLVNQPFTFLPAPFDGFGSNVTYSYIDSSSGIRDQRTNSDLLIEGLSKHNVNVVGYYEKGPFGIRVAWNWRDKYLDKIGIGGDGVFFEPYDNLSASLNYEIARGILFTLQGSNLADTPVRKYGGFEEATNTYLENGRTFSAALRVKF